MLKVGIVGASGYTGAELARLLTNHPQVELTAATSRQFAGQPLAKVFPNLRNRVNITCENLSVSQLADRADFFFTAVPHKTAMEIVPELLKKGKKVVDLSADYRIKDAQTYERWYQQHTSISLLKEAVYGLPELYRDKITTSDLVANPGCYPTSVILAIAPLLQNDLIDPATLIIDSKSGTSGAGRSANIGALFCEVHDGFKPYKVGGTHRHIPEIEQELSLLAQKKINISFTPHLLPIARGILSTSYASLNEKGKQEDISSLFQAAYEHEPFVRVLAEGDFPATQHVRGSNYCDIAVQKDPRTGRVIVISAIDNITKGASGQAIQNLNIINGFPEETGLLSLPLFP